MSDLNITLIQSELAWEQHAANREQFGRLIGGISEPTDLVVLPEMFSTGFSMNAVQHAEHSGGQTLQWMAQMASQKQAVVCGSLMFGADGQYCNRLFWMRPDGEYRTYDKRHLFRMGDEQLHYEAGSSRLLVKHKGWRIFPVVCYDLRFPVWLRRTKDFDYDLMIVVANWPERRSLHWKALLVARAIENQCYVAAVNRIGSDGNGVYHSGDSMLVSPRGEIIFTQENEPFCKTLTLSMDEVRAYREQFPAIEDADTFHLIV